MARLKSEAVEERMSRDGVTCGRHFIFEVIYYAYGF